MNPQRFPFLLACVLGLWASEVALPAQSLTRTLESLVRTNPEAPEEKPSSASDQLPWTQEQAATAQTRRDLFSSDAFRERLAAADFPETSRPDFLRQAQLALDFHVYYWLEIGSCNPRQVGSEMRRQIDRLFRERNIEIAFPQQDVHLKIDGPVPLAAPAAGNANAL